MSKAEANLIISSSVLFT